MIVVATLAGGVLSVVLAAMLALTLLRRWAQRLVSFAVGVLLATALLNLMPEASNALGPELAGAWLLGGVLIFFVLEKLALWRHAHVHGDDAHHDHAHVPSSAPSPAGAMIVLGDGLHNFVDGILIAAAFLTDPALGIATAMAVIAHEIPQELGDFMVLLNAGYTRRRALLLNALSGAAALGGGLLGYIALQGAQHLIPYALALSAASFLYIAIADLVPELHRARKRFSELLLQSLLISAGIATVALLHRH